MKIVEEVMKEVEKATAAVNAMGKGDKMNRFDRFQFSWIGQKILAVLWFVTLPVQLVIALFLPKDGK
jgi:hypothetical protein